MADLNEILFRNLTSKIWVIENELEANKQSSFDDILLVDVLLPEYSPHTTVRKFNKKGRISARQFA